MSDIHPLVCRFGAFGDLVMITPLLKHLYRRCGLPADVAALGHWSKLMFQQMPYVRNVYTIDSRNAPYIFNRSQQIIVKQIRAHHYQNAWICEHKSKSYRLMKQSGIDLAKSICANNYPLIDNEHSALRFLKLGNETPHGFNYETREITELNAELFVSDAEIEECKQWLQAKKIGSDLPIVCVQAGNRKTVQVRKIGQRTNPKYWPEDRWAQVIDTVLELDARAEVLLCGVPSEQSIALSIKSLSKRQERVHCVADDLPLRRLMALLSIAQSCISVDTGPAHAAAALNCPVTVLFGDTDPRLCRPVSAHSKVIVVAGRDESREFGDGKASWASAHTMDLISPEAVVKGWQESINDEQ